MILLSYLLESLQEDDVIYKGSYGPRKKYDDSIDSYVPITAGKTVDDIDEKDVCMECLLEYLSSVNESILVEAEYHGKKVKLGKPMRGDVKKFKVYVKNKKGNVIKVNFGDPNMRIKKSNPARRRSFRARHKCATAKDRTTARYWSCKKW